MSDCNARRHINQAPDTQLFQFCLLMYVFCCVFPRAERHVLCQCLVQRRKEGALILRTCTSRMVASIIQCLHTAKARSQMCCLLRRLLPGEWQCRCIFTSACAGIGSNQQGVQADFELCMRVHVSNPSLCSRPASRAPFTWQSSVQASERGRRMSQDQLCTEKHGGCRAPLQPPCGRPLNAHWLPCRHAHTPLRAYAAHPGAVDTNLMR